MSNNRENLERYFAVEETRGFKAARGLEDFVNGGFSETDGFIQGFLRMHNTLQQSTVRLMFKCIEAMAAVPYVDGRNQASKLTAQRVLDGYREQMRLFWLSEGMTEEKAKEYSEMDWTVPSGYLPTI
tara:strand:- start:3028 stop:3408 length:381 start_codon:yes stop_codon:yes gene_type:complete